MSQYVTIAHFQKTLFTYQPVQSPIIHKGQARDADGLHRLVRKTQDWPQETDKFLSDTESKPENRRDTLAWKRDTIPTIKTLHGLAIRSHSAHACQKRDWLPHVDKRIFKCKLRWLCAAAGYYRNRLDNQPQGPWGAALHDHPPTSQSWSTILVHHKDQPSWSKMWLQQRSWGEIKSVICIDETLMWWWGREGKRSSICYVSPDMLDL